MIIEIFKQTVIIVTRSHSEPLGIVFLGGPFPITVVLIDEDSAVLYNPGVIEAPGRHHADHAQSKSGKDESV